MSVLIIVESLFGNTLAVARAVAAGLTGRGADVTVLRCGEAPTHIPAEVSLLVAGAPTHNFHLPNRASRTQAAGRGAAQADVVGLAEWIGTATPRPDLRVGHVRHHHGWGLRRFRSQDCSEAAEAPRVQRARTGPGVHRHQHARSAAGR